MAGTVSNATIDSRAAYWCVADLFSRAAAAGGETAGSARQLAGRYAGTGLEDSFNAELVSLEAQDSCLDRFQSRAGLL